MKWGTWNQKQNCAMFVYLFELILSNHLFQSVYQSQGVLTVLYCWNQYGFFEGQLASLTSELCVYITVPLKLVKLIQNYQQQPDVTITRSSTSTHIAASNVVISKYCTLLGGNWWELSDQWELGRVLLYIRPVVVTLMQEFTFCIICWLHWNTIH